MSAESVQCVVTSPPYWGLRDYGLPPSTWGDGWTGCLGLEPTPQQFLVHLVELFGEVRRVLRRDGTCWFNMGDCYASPSAPGGGSPRATEPGRKHDDQGRALCKEAHKSWPGGTSRGAGLAAKQRLLMPARCALALQADGWWVRSEIVWAKPNPMPSSVTDRPTDEHEMLYLLTRAPRYFYDADAVRERHKEPGRVNTPNGHRRDANEARRGTGGGETSYNPAGRNRRTVWTIPTQAYKGAHFATFPEKLVAPCILAGTSERGACSECGAPWRRVVDVKGGSIGSGDWSPDGSLETGDNRPGTWSNPADYTRTTTGWEPTCAHADAPTVPCVVLDPFSGSGTTGLVARKLGRSYVGIELSEEYLELSRARLGDRDALAELREGEDETDAQLGLFG